MELKEEVAEVFFGAADLCESGWCQFAYSRRINDTGPEVQWCAVGAINRSKDYVSEAARNATRCLGNFTEKNLTFFNDELGRTQGEVVEYLREIGNKVLKGEIKL